jgi:SAM-dependent methyltransferase
MSYDAFATTFSNSRKNLHWPELEYIIADMKQQGYMSVLDVGCGNGRFLTEINNSKLIIQNYFGIDTSDGMIREARKLHPDHQFEVCSMLDLSTFQHFNISTFHGLLFLASFHHLATREERIQVMQDSKKLLTPNGRIYMTNWNLRDQERYEASHR